MLGDPANGIPSRNVCLAILTSALRVVASSLVWVVASRTGVPIGHSKSTRVAHVRIVIVLDLVG